MDFDPRDYDSRDEARFGPDRDRDAHERDVDRYVPGSELIPAGDDATLGADDEQNGRSRLLVPSRRRSAVESSAADERSASPP